MTGDFCCACEQEDKRAYRNITNVSDVELADVYHHL